MPCPQIMQHSLQFILFFYTSKALVNRAHHPQSVWAKLVTLRQVFLAHPFEGGENILYIWVVLKQSENLR